MKTSQPLIQTALILLLCSASASAQERPIVSIPPASDVKTAPESGAASLAPPAIPLASPQASAAAKSADDADGVAPPLLLGRLDRTRVHYDAPGDGSLWARGERFKMSFDAAGATYFPLWGPRQPRHFPHALSPDAVTIGGEPLAFTTAAGAVRANDRVEIDRGSFVERYELTAGSIEQVFVFPSLPRAGDLVVHVPLASALDAAEDASGFELRSELGRVKYGRAIAIDGRGERVDAATVLRDGSIEIRVDAAFLATAELPLVIDPVITTFAVDESSFNDRLPDVAYDAGTQRWIAVYEEPVTSSDNDVYYVMMNEAGATMWGGYINSNNASWNGPRCANLRTATQFLVVASVEGSGSVAIRGRTVEADISFVEGEFFISGAESGDKISPDVGGDSYPFAPAWYCVAYERIFDDDDRDILVRLVAPDSTIHPIGTIFLSNSGGTIDQHPNLSKSNGGGTWMIAWDRHVDFDPFQVWAGRIRYDGFTSNGPFLVANSGLNDLQASASTPLYGSERTMITWQRNFDTHWDIMGAVFDGATLVTEANLATLANNGFQGQSQQFASVDSDGLHFSVAYAELFGTSTTDWDIMIDDFFMSDNSLRVAQTRQIAAFTTSNEFNPQIASKYGSGGPYQRYMTVWAKRTSATNSDIRGALFDGFAGGSVASFCSGDGSAGFCPCNNMGAVGHGCASSVNPNGALLTMTGFPSTLADTSALRIEGVPGTSSCLFFQGTASSNAMPFGDGLRCVAGNVVRIGTANASGGVATFPPAGGSTLSSLGFLPINGGRRTYQTWYRNSANFCTTSVFNMSNGLDIAWSR
jgi:hypothetical protein